MKKSNINRFMRKLHSESGASLAVALLFFIVCAIVGSIVLTAATASMGRISAMGKDQENKYAVQSAANVLVNELQGNEMSFEAVSGTVSENDLQGSTIEFEEIKYGFGIYSPNTKPAANQKLSSLIQYTDGDVSFMGRNGDLQLLERSLGGLIYLKDKEVTAASIHKITGTWDKTTDGKYSKNWQLSDSDADIFHYMTEKPAAITAAYRGEEQKVMAIFSIDANFNISIVLYPATSITSKTEDDLAKMTDPQKAVEKADHVLYVKIPAQVTVHYSIDHTSSQCKADCDVVWGVDVTDNNRSNVTITSNKAALDVDGFFEK